MPFFSVIVPTFNRVELLKSTVHSILAQRYTDFELIVVDDGSNDETLEYLRTLGTKVAVLQQSNKGPGSARNRGAQTATGEYLAFLDSDDVWFPWTLEVYREVVKTWSEPSFVAGKPKQFIDEKELATVTVDSVQASGFRDYLASGNQWRWFGVSSFVIRRDDFLAVGGFRPDPINGEDCDLALRLGIAPKFVQITKPITFAYREHASSAMKDFGRTVAGARSLILAEQGGQYPGGASRAAERWRILTRHTRPVTLECLDRCLWRDAWDMYASTLKWNVSGGRLKYTAAFPLRAASRAVRMDGRRAAP